eukprot:58682-Pyramimonas_sp.AAC.1
MCRRGHAAADPGCPKQHMAAEQPERTLGPAREGPGAHGCLSAPAEPRQGGTREAQCALSAREEEEEEGRRSR